MNRTKRILHDILTIEKDPMEGIHISYNDNIDTIKAMIEGNKDTPYEFGFFAFDVEFPPTYPHAPPLVSFINPNKNVRYHPNLYRCGKVCLSLLGTWAGPQWTSCQTLKSVLLSLQSIMDEHPMRNEPSFETLKATSSVNIHYNMIVTYHSLLSGCIGQTIDPCCKDFSEIIMDKFQKTKPLILEKINTLKQHNGALYKSRIYGMSLKFDTDKLLHLLEPPTMSAVATNSKMNSTNSTKSTKSSIEHESL